jgi:hypothetical protein
MVLARQGLAFRSHGNVVDCQDEVIAFLNMHRPGNTVCEAQKRHNMTRAGFVDSCVKP